MSGEGKISLALGGAKKGKPAPTNGIKRSRAALHDGEDEEQVNGKAQTVSHFDRSAGGAIDEANKPKKEQPLVIKPQANRDWREASQRNKRQKVPEALQQNGREAEIEAMERANKPKFGLNVKEGAEGAAESEAMDVEGLEHAQQVPLEANGEASAKQKTDEELAMDALLGKTTKSDLVLPAMTEEEAFERDFRSAPDMSTLEEYARVPVEQFGAALLRGMGWKEGEGIGNQRGQKVEKVKVPERRPALLGIGAKEEAAVKEEMGAWGKAARGKDAKVYNPVLLRDKRTGEMFTEDEVEKRKAEEARKQYEMEFEEKERRKEKDKSTRDDDRNGDRREKDGRRQRDKDDRRRDGSDEEYNRRKEEKRRRREREREESDEEYYRRKEKDKRRRERDHRDSDRERSRRHDGSRERHRDPDRDRKRRD